MEAILEVLNRDYKTIPVTSIGKELAIDWTKLNAETLAHLVWHGVKQKANDPNGAKDLSDSEKEGNSLKVIGNLEANELRARTGTIADPFEAEVMRLAVVAISNKLLAKGKKLKDYKMADLRKLAQEALDTREDFRATIHETATKILADKAQLIAMLADDEEEESETDDSTEED